MRRLHTFLNGLGKLGRRPRAGGTPQHRNPPGHRFARVEALEDRHLLSLGDLLLTLPVSGGWGSSVAVSGDTVVVGAAFATDLGGHNSGSAYIFDASTGNLLRTLNKPTRESGGWDDPSYGFGLSVAVSGNTVVVGAPFEDIVLGWSDDGYDVRIDAGSAYVFDAATGNLLHTLDNPTPEERDSFGWPVAVSGSTAVVAGFPGAYLFDTGTGELRSTFDTEGLYDVDVSEGTAVVANASVGAAYILDATTGNLLWTLDDPTPGGGAFGCSAAVSGNTVVVGDYAVGAGTGSTGAAYIYDATTGNLLRTLTKPTPTKDDLFGISVAVSGSTVVVGAENAAYLFDAGTGDVLATLNASGAVAVSGSTVMVDGYVFDGDRTSHVDLLAGSDSGASDTDNVTNLDNSSAARTLQFVMSETVPGATVTIYADGTAIGNATATGVMTTVTTDGAHDLADGTHTITARQTEPGKPESPDTPALTITLDTEAPSVPAAPDLQAASDTGASQTDNITADNTPTFDLSGAGPYFRFYRGGTRISADYESGSTFTTPAQPDGTHDYEVSSVDLAGNESSPSDGLSVTIDASIPSADIVDVTPDPRTSAVSDITIIFSEVVYGFDLADLKLARNGVNVALTAATLTTTDNVTWTLGNLSGLSGGLGTYDLTLTAAGSGITDSAGSPLWGDATDHWLVNPAVFNGSSGDDLFEFIAASPSANPLFHQMKVTFSGRPTVTYLYGAAGMTSLTINAGAGCDTLKITGGPGTDTSNIYRFAINHTGPGYTVYAPLATGSLETIIVDGGGGTGEKATLHNGPAAGDRFTALSWQRTGSMVGTGTGNVYNNSVKNFDLIYGLANGGGTNAIADLTDSYGNDLFVSKPEGAPGYSIMQHVGGDSRPCAYLLAGVGFSTIYGRSTRGGTDEAVLNGSSGDDTVLLQPQMRRAFLMKAGGGQTTYAVDFKKVTTYPLGGANDQAYLQGTTLDDVFTATAGTAQMSGTIPAMGVPYLNIAADGMGGQRWDKVYGQVNVVGATGGIDKAYLSGTTGDDTLTATGTPRIWPPSPAGVVKLSGAGYYIEAQQFDEVYADLKTGNDTANLYDSTSAGTDTFFGNLHDAVLSDGTLDLANGNLLAAASYYYRITGFDSSASDHVNLWGSSIGGPNHKKVIDPLDYVLAVTGPWTDP